MRTAALSLAFAASLFATSANAAPSRFSDIVVFGDSLSDVGNAQIGTALFNAANPGLPPLPDPAPASVGFFAGRFSNGPIYLDALNAALTDAGGPSRPSIPLFVPGTGVTGGLNFAVGGARAVANAGDFIPDLEGQLFGIGPRSAGPITVPPFPGYAQFLDSTGGSLDPRALYVVAMGNNDARAVANGASDAPNLSQSANTIVSAVSQLLAAGARHVLLVNVGDLGLSPVFNGGGEAAATDASRQLNGFLADSLDGFATTGTHSLRPFGLDAFLSFFDFFAWSQQIASDPTAFGLPSDIDLETPCFAAAVTDPTVLPGCEGYGWSDAIHPSSSVHAALASSIRPLLEAQLVPAPAMLALFGLGTLALGLARRKRAA